MLDQQKIHWQNEQKKIDTWQQPLNREDQLIRVWIE